MPIFMTCRRAGVHGGRRVRQAVSAITERCTLHANPPSTSSVHPLALAVAEDLGHLGASIWFGVLTDARPATGPSARRRTPGRRWSRPASRSMSAPSTCSRILRVSDELAGDPLRLGLPLDRPAVVALAGLEKSHPLHTEIFSAAETFCIRSAAAAAWLLPSSSPSARRGAVTARQIQSDGSSALSRPPSRSRAVRRRCHHHPHRPPAYTEIGNGISHRRSAGEPVHR